MLVRCIFLGAILACACDAGGVQATSDGTFDCEVCQQQDPVPCWRAGADVVLGTEGLIRELESQHDYESVGIAIIVVREDIEAFKECLATNVGRD